MAIKYRWLTERLEELIDKGIQNGVPKLPTERELCARYHVSRQTVRMSLELLKQKGLIVGKQGSGSFITGRSAKPRGNTVGILLSSDRDYIYPGVLSDIRATLSQNGFSGQVFITENCVSYEREILLQLLKNPLRAMIVEGCKSALPNPNLDLYRKLMKKGCQIVFLFNSYKGLSGPVCIKDDNYLGSSLLVRHLAARGHTQIAGIFKADDLQGIERYQGFMETLRDLGLPVTDRRVCWYGSRELNLILLKKDTRFLKETVMDCLSLSTAAVCYNDLIAYRLVDELLLAGYELPADMAVAAFDNTYLSNSNLLSVTTLSHKPREMGTKAAEAVIKKLSGLPVTSREIPWTLNPKGST